MVGVCREDSRPDESFLELNVPARLHKCASFTCQNHRSPAFHSFATAATDHPFEQSGPVAGANGLASRRNASRFDGEEEFTHAHDTTGVAANVFIRSTLSNTGFMKLASTACSVVSGEPFGTITL